MNCIELRQQHDALLLVGIGASNHRDAAFYFTQIVRQMRNVGGDVEKFTGAHDQMSLGRLLSRSAESEITTLCLNADLARLVIGHFPSFTPGHRSSTSADPMNNFVMTDGKSR
jgi:hypothetical protein